MIPAGVVPLGSFTEVSGSRARKPIPILADYVDELSGQVTRLTEGRTPVDGAIIEILRVERGSGPAVKENGHTMREVRHTDESSLSELKARLRDGFRRMEVAGLVQIQETTVEVNEGIGDAVTLSSRIRDLTLPPEDQEATRTYAVTRGLPNG